MKKDRLNQHLSALFILIASFGVVLSSPADECRDAANRLKPLVTEKGWPDMSYAQYAASHPVQKIPFFSKSQLPELWDYRWIADLTERSRRKNIHAFIQSQVVLARRGVAVAERVKAISEYLEDREMMGVATQALGVIGHPSALPALAALIEKDIEVVGTDLHYQEFIHRAAFWAPQALGSLDFSRNPAEYRKAEQILFRLQEAQSKVRFNIAPTLYDGLTALGSTKVRKMLGDNLKAKKEIWMTARAIATLKDPAFILHLYIAALSTNDEKDFATLIIVLSGFREQFAIKGIDGKRLFTDLVRKLFTFTVQNGQTLIALEHLRPSECQWD